jgi:GAF domain-containing protein
MPDLAIALGYRSCLFVPLLKDGKALGSLTILRETTGDFDAQEVALAQTFADQAVIAIENARLFNETREALERQTATSEVLRVISGSVTDTQPVFDVIAERSARLTGATTGWVFRFDGELIHIGGIYAVNAQGIDETRRLYPMRTDGGSGGARAVREKAVINVADVLSVSDSEYSVKNLARLVGFRAVLAVPMMRDREVVGAISVTRSEPGLFADKEITLLQTFASQAVIAIENVRLFNETKEALERQTATTEVLRVISASMTETQPVFDVIAERAVRLTGATLGFVFRFDGEQIHISSAHGVNPEGLDAARKAFPMPPSDASATARAVRDGVVVNIGDVHMDTDVGYKTLDIARLAGYRAVLAVPMLREREIIGAIAVTRAEPGLFAEREVDLLRTFASQAVIAIENVRLFNETKEALERQTRPPRCSR